MVEDNEVSLAAGLFDGIELMPLQEAYDRYEFVRDLLWSLVDKDKDQYTKMVHELEQRNGYTGYFIRALPGAKIEFPLQACFFLKSQGTSQLVHNLLIAEEGSELHVINGCTSGLHVVEGRHVGISEFFIRKGARLSYTMVHEWAPEIRVFPRTGILVDEDGTFISNYISLDEVHEVQSYPTAELAGPRAKARFYSVVLAPENSLLDLGARGILSAPETGVEIISRTVSTGGKVIARGHIIGAGENATGHMECDGLIINKGHIHAIPELDARIENITLSHEAAVGKLSEEEIDYLRTRGLSEEEARALIVSGFLQVKIEGIPNELQKQLDETIALGASKAGM